jgi:hypothetical protein
MGALPYQPLQGKGLTGQSFWKKPTPQTPRYFWNIEDEQTDE